MQYCHLVYCVMTGLRVDAAQIVSNEIHSFVTKKVKAKGSLGFPALITHMCIKARVPNIRPTYAIEGSID